MNNEIIPIHEENGNFPVTGRELHSRLEIETVLTAKKTIGRFRTKLSKTLWAVAMLPITC